MSNYFLRQKAKPPYGIQREHLKLWDLSSSIGAKTSVN